MWVEVVVAGVVEGLEIRGRDSDGVGEKGNNNRSGNSGSNNVNDNSDDIKGN